MIYGLKLGIKLRRLAILASSLALTLFIGNTLQSEVGDKSYAEIYPPVICPVVGSGTNSQVSLNSSSKLVRPLYKKRVSLNPAKTTRLLISNNSVLVDGQGVNALTWISKAGVWAGGLTCLSPQASQYLVGSSADVASKSKLVLANSGLSASTVDVIVYSENTSFDKQVSVPANQTVSIPIVTLAPGSKTIALKVTPKAGRVAAYLVDERGKGLTALGGDLVNSQAELSKTLYIPAIAHTLALQKTHVLRVLNPNSVKTNFTVELLSNNGRYVPVGFDYRSINGDRVLDIPFDFDAKTSVFGMKITSDLPIAAAVYSRVRSANKADFVWSTPVPAAEVGTWAITGLDPLFVATGSEIDISLRILMPKRKQIDKNLSGTDFLTYKIPQGALGIQIRTIGDDNAAALIVSSQSGTGYLPLLNGSILSRSTVPTANIGVLNP